MGFEELDAWYDREKQRLGDRLAAGRGSEKAKKSYADAMAKLHKSYEAKAARMEKSEERLSRIKRFLRRILR